MMKKRNFEGNIIFELDSDGDNYESFQFSKNYVIKCGAEAIDYYSGFFDSAYFIFKLFNLNMKIEYSGFFGTELKIAENVDEQTLVGIKVLAQNMFDIIHKI